MAENEAPETTAPKPPAKKGSMKLIMIIGAVTVVEAAMFFAGMQFLGGGPQVAHGADGENVTEGPDPTTQPGSVEIHLLERFRVPNHLEGRTWIYEVDVIIQTPAHRRADAERIRDERKGAIMDSIAGTVRSLEPRVLNEPDVRTLRTQVQRALTSIFEPDMIQSVFIPRCVPLRGGT